MTRPPLLFRLNAAARDGFQRHGPLFPWKVLSCAAAYFQRKNFGTRHFSLGGQEHSYEIHPFILDNERTVEVGLARKFVSGRSGRILEIGNVLANFMSFPHDVLDKYEKAPGVLNEDIVGFSPQEKYQAIVTLSTLEHVGWDETPRTPEKILQAIEHTKSLLVAGGELLATMPIAYNSYLDQLIREQRTGFSQVRFMVRITKNNLWREATLAEAIACKFGSPFGCANAIMVGTFRAPGRAA